MVTKVFLRKKFLKLRKTKYKKIGFNYYLPLLKFLKKFKKNKVLLSIYMPCNYEVDTASLFNLKKMKTVETLIPVIKKNNLMKFYKWSKNETLIVNKLGILEPVVQKRSFIPDVILLPLLCFDSKKYRLGYGKGYYDRYLTFAKKKNKKITSIGVSFNFQKIKKIPISRHDVKMDWILTEKGLH